MKKQTFDLNKMGLSPLNEFELQEIDGGSIWTWLCGAAGAVIGFLTAGPIGAINGAIIGMAVGAATDQNPDPNVQITVGGHNR